MKHFRWPTRSYEPVPFVAQVCNPRFHIPLIKPDVQISRIKCGRPHLMRYVVPANMWCRRKTSLEINAVR
jgi:hypothetical protein